MRELGIAIALAMGASCVFAADVAGAGAAPCGYLLEGKPEMKASWIAWTQGWLSGFNSGREVRSMKTLDIPPPEALYVSLQNYCKAHPLDRVQDGVFDLLGQLMARQLNPNEWGTEFKPKEKGASAKP
jgi:hypothetical protein